MKAVHFTLCRFFIPFVLILGGGSLFSACNKNEQYINAENAVSKTILRSFSVTMDDIDIYLHRYKGIKDTKSPSIQVEPVLSGVDTIMFLINYDDGWELLSADVRAPRVIAMAERGHITLQQISEAPDEVTLLFSSFANKVLFLKHNPAFTDNNSFDEDWGTILPNRFNDGWELVNSIVLESYEEIQNHLTSTVWGQNYPWNIRAPYTNSTLSSHCLTGCVPVAAAQILYYLHDKIGVPAQSYGDSFTQAYIPSTADSLVLQNSDVVFDNATYSALTWENMPLSNSGTGLYETVSTLMVQVGLFIGAEYYVGHTSGVFSHVKTAFQNQYSIPCIGTYNIDMSTIVNSIIDDEMPVFLGISEYNENGQRLYGHGVVVDAAKRQYTLIRNNYICELENINGELIIYQKSETVEERTPKYVGINWGWDGAYMYSGSSPIWFSTESLSWSTGYYTWNNIDYMIYGFSSCN